MKQGLCAITLSYRIYWSNHCLTRSKEKCGANGGTSELLFYNTVPTIGISCIAPPMACERVKLEDAKPPFKNGKAQRWQEHLVLTYDLGCLVNNILKLEQLESSITLSREQNPCKEHVDLTSTQSGWRRVRRCSESGLRYIHWMLEGGNGDKEVDVKRAVASFAPVNIWLHTAMACFEGRRRMPMTSLKTFCSHSEDDVVAGYCTSYLEDWIFCWVLSCWRCCKQKKQKINYGCTSMSFWLEKKVIFEQEKTWVFGNLRGGNDVSLLHYLTLNYFFVSVPGIHSTQMFLKSLQSIKLVKK